MRLTAAILFLIALLGGCATGQPVGRSATDPVAVSVVRNGDRWTADFILDRDAPVWAFRQSALLRESRQPWRPDWWTVETPGVVLERQGRYDILRASDGGPLPRQVRISLRPQVGDLEAEYDPALVFSDGAVALYSEQFNLIPLETIEAARALPLDLNGVDLPGGPSAVTWRDQSGPVLFKGERRSEVTARDPRTYVLFGDARTVRGEAVTTVIDPALPAWLGQELRAFTPRVMDYYASRLGEAKGEAPTVMVSWTGPTASLSSMGGSVLPGLITMSFEGEGVMNRSPQVLDRAHWFIGHEAAHFWMGSGGLRYEFARDAWITEGGADLMAIRAIRTINPAYNDRAELQTEVDDCISLSRGRAVASAGERGEHRAYYACGAVWGLVAEGHMRRGSGGDFFDFIRELQRANPDGVVSRADWLQALTRASGDEAASASIARLLDGAANDPAGEIAGMLSGAGVSHRREGERVVLS